MDDSAFNKPENKFSLLQEQYENAFQTNEISTFRWETYKENLEEVQKNLGDYSKQLKCPIMVPIGKKAFMKGNLVHTNECLVCLGDGWFVKQSAAQTEEFCARRIEYCDEKLNSLKKELDLLDSRRKFPLESDAFAQENAQEIIEPYDEEAEAAWRIKHREREKEYRRKLAEQRKKAVQKEEENVWEKLSRLEIEEKSGRLESIDEGDLNDDEYLDGDDYSTDTLSDEFVEEEEEDNIENPNSTTERKRSITFDLEEHSDDNNYDDVILIKFKHSKVVDSSVTNSKSDQNTENVRIEKPSDIYQRFSHFFKPKSILKKSSSIDQGNIVRLHTSLSSIIDSDPEAAAPNHNLHKVSHSAEDVEPLPQVFGEIVERKLADTPKQPEPPPPLQPSTMSKPISKFKAARKAAS